MLVRKVAAYSHDGVPLRWLTTACRCAIDSMTITALHVKEPSVVWPLQLREPFFDVGSLKKVTSGHIKMELQNKPLQSQIFIC
jgi:hypothetical protein